VTAAGRLDSPKRARLATALIDAVQREYPHVLAQELHADADVVPPRVLNPSFFGSYDWHSAVHCHWSLVRLLVAGLPKEVTSTALEVLDDHLGPERLAGELAFYSGPGGRVAERPYGWAWLVLLHAECQRVAPTYPPAAKWAEALTPLSELLRGRLVRYFKAVLAFPVRAGTHPNTAFALQLLLQAARATGDAPLAGEVSEAAQRFFTRDHPLPWAGPPSGADFLDPPLVEAALMADVLGEDHFASWLAQVCPPGSVPDWQPPEFVRDASEPGAVHLEGLLISRAWCLDRLARAPASALAEAARLGRDQHLQEVAGIDPCDSFSRSHWLPTYLVYLDGWLEGAL
jgi:hypothetical protein